jgi:hypothetical protein
MIKIAIMSTCDEAKSVLKRKIAEEWLAMGYTEDDCFLGEDIWKYRIAVDDLHDRIVACVCGSISGQISAALDTRCGIYCSTVMDHILRAKALGIKSEMISALEPVAMQWMQTYDTIVFIENGDLAPVVHVGDTIGLLEAEYCRWIQEHGDNFPITIIPSDRIYKEQGNWLI